MNRMECYLNQINGIGSIDNLFFLGFGWEILYIIISSSIDSIIHSASRGQGLTLSHCIYSVGAASSGALASSGARSTDDTKAARGPAAPNKPESTKEYS